MNDINEMLEFNRIREMLKDAAVCAAAKRRAETLMPFMDQTAAENALQETTQARQALDRFGTPPAGDMDTVRELAAEAGKGGLLSADQLEEVRQFTVLCARLVRYLKKCRDGAPWLAGFGAGIDTLDGLQEEIERCIRGGRVDDCASKRLRGIRQRSEQTEAELRLKLETLLKNNRGCFSENFVSARNGHYTLPVKKEYRSKVPGTVIDTSSTGATLFIEPAPAARLREELEMLRMEEENEEKLVLGTLSAMVGEEEAVIDRNLEYMEELDFIFAKGKLSSSMKAVEPGLNTDRRICIVNGRHPLLAGGIVPLSITFGGDTRGVIITGPNTGGKTVALKTVGLLSVMAQCGLHVPCEKADLAMQAEIFCDIGDGQSISENLSTFSSHIRKVIRILEQADRESLVLLDELGSGTDPAEGMGLAVAVLEELRSRGCLFLVTTHYPEVKEYGERAEGVINARMAFDRESLKPLYRLELGESGESCAFYIAARLGMPERLLERARAAAYGAEPEKRSVWPDESSGEQREKRSGDGTPEKSRIRARQEPDRGRQRREEISARFAVGDSVMVYPQRKLGIVFAPADEKGEVGVQIQKKKQFISHKRLQLKVSASQMYPPDYDFSILFDTVENRKARHQMSRKYVPGLEISYDETKGRGADKESR